MLCYAILILIDAFTSNVCLQCLYYFINWMKWFVIFLSARFGIVLVLARLRIVRKTGSIESIQTSEQNPELSFETYHAKLWFYWIQTTAHPTVCFDNWYKRYRHAFILPKTEKLHFLHLRRNCSFYFCFFFVVFVFIALIIECIIDKVSAKCWRGVW